MGKKLQTVLALENLKIKMKKDDWKSPEIPQILSEISKPNHILFLVKKLIKLPNWKQILFQSAKLKGSLWFHQIAFNFQRKMSVAKRPDVPGLPNSQM